MYRPFIKSLHIGDSHSGRVQLEVKRSDFSSFHHLIEEGYFRKNKNKKRHCLSRMEIQKHSHAPFSLAIALRYWWYMKGITLCYQASQATEAKT